MIGFVLSLALVAALAAAGLRRRRRARLAQALRTRPGASMELSIYVRSFAEIDEHLARRPCTCGETFEKRGEGTREASGRRFRVARLVCPECEAEEEVFFDTTELLH